MLKKFSILLLILAAVFTLTACDSIGGTQNGSGDLALSIADKPVNDVEKVLVTIEEVQVKKEDDNGWKTINDFAEDGGEKEFDLITLKFNEALLGQERLEAGFYDQIRLIVAADDQDSDPKTAGKSRVVYKEELNKDDDPLFIPSGTQSGLKIEHNFEIRDETITKLLLDVDVREIMHQTGNKENNGKIILRPTAIDIIDQLVSGSIAGRVVKVVDGEQVYEFENDVVIEAYKKDDLIADSDPIRITVASAEEETVEGEVYPAGSFKLRGLEAGTYKLKVYTADEAGNAVGDLEEIVEVDADHEEIIVKKGEITKLKENIVLE